MSAGKEDIIVAVFIVTAAVAGMVTHTLFLIALKDSVPKQKIYMIEVKMSFGHKKIIFVPPKCFLQNPKFFTSVPEISSLSYLNIFFAIIQSAPQKSV